MVAVFDESLSIIVDINMLLIYSINMLFHCECILELY